LSEEREETIEDRLEGKDRKRRITIWVVVAVVVIAVIGGTVLFTKGATPTEATELTLEGINTQLQEVANKVTSLESATAGNTEDIADLGIDIENITDPTLPDYTEQFANINSRLTTLEADLASLQYAYVSRAEPGYVDITLLGGGDYAVFATLYGMNLNGIAVRYPLEYSIKQTWGSNTTVTLAIEPVLAWLPGGLVELKLLGTLYYATARTGQGCVGSVPEW